ncbi:MAG: heavy-metal-associated domain-containing protein [Clostridia bacterium]|nr:heavy-metal-associated domain-containing protein [Clostridia bacterium]
MTKAAIKVGGMSCGHCKAAVEKALGDLNGVKAARADLDSGVVEVEYESDSLGENDLEQAIIDAGYEVM